jgi:hypothetical protein
LVPGPATFELQLIEGGNVLETRTLPLTLQPNVTGVASLTLPTTTIAIGGSSSFAATLRNPGAALSGVLLQGWIDQGATRRAAGGSMVFLPGQPVGVLPSGLSDVPGFIGVSNTGAGNGTLVPGAAIFELQMIMNGTLLETRTVPITLV